MRYKEVKKIIDNWDPMNLRCCFCPPDEYDREIKKIWEASKNKSDISQITQVIFNCFNEFQKIDQCRPIAEKILCLENGEPELQYHCPLLDRIITETYCSDINMFVLGGRQLKSDKDHIACEKAFSICTNCDNFFWQKEDVKKMLLHIRAMYEIHKFFEEHIKKTDKTDA